MPFRSEKQRRYLWKNNPEIARKWTNEHGSTPVKAKKGKYQELEHPDHEIKPIEHKEENVSSKERVEKLLDERKTKKETKKKLVKQGQNYVPGWRPNLSVKAKDSKYIQKKSPAKQGLEYTNWILKDDKSLYGHKIEKRPSSKWDKSIKSIREIYKRAKEDNKGEDRLTAQDIKNAQKAIQGEKKQLESVVDVRSKGGPIKAKKGLWTGAKTNIFEAPSGWDAKKISKKTGEKLFKVFKHRERGGYKQATDYKKYLKGLKKTVDSRRVDILKNPKFDPGRLGKNLKSYKALGIKTEDAYFKYRHKDPAFKKRFNKVAKAQSPFLKRRFKLAGLSSNIPISKKTKYFKDMIKTVGVFPLVNKKDIAKSPFLKRRFTLAGPSSFPTVKSKSLYFKDAPKASKLSTVLKKVGRKTHIGKAVAAATVVAGAYEAGKRKIFSRKNMEKNAKDWLNVKDKKKVDKKSIGGETVIMKSGGGYIDDLL